MAAVEIPCRDLDEGIATFVEQFGFRLDMIMPADAPSVAVLSGHGVEVRLVAPDGAGDSSPGRAGMRYRDLLPSREGGRFIASHITIPDGGPVPDYVHHHDVRLQLIHCVRGWVRVVYEDQGPPFVLAAGECVVQPPGIRHRVLEASPGLEVLEVTSPAVHATHVDHDLELPTAALNPDRPFGGQRFVHAPAGDPAIAAASDGLIGARMVQPELDERIGHEGELLLWFVVTGSVTLRAAGRDDVTLGAGDAVAVPSGVAHAVAVRSADLDVVEVSVPALVHA